MRAPRTHLLASLCLLCSADCSETVRRSPGHGDGPVGDPDPLGVGQYAMVSLTGGTSIGGEVVAVYDHSLWWDDAADELTYALFRPELLAQYPEDDSIALISSMEIAAASAAIGRISYRDTLREQGVVIRGPPIAGAYVITGNDSYHREENGFGDFAWDLVVTDASGARYTGAGLANEEYLVWDTPVTLPTGGCVVEVVSDVPDNLPGSYTPGSANNLVGVHLFGSYYLYLLHFRQHSIDPAVTVGTCLPQGTYLGQVGNAGVSLEPHLHLTVLWYDADGAPPRSWSVPVEWADLYTASQADGVRQHADFLVPRAGTWLFAGE